MMPTALLDMYGFTHTKLPSCSDYGKTWNLRSSFLLHLHEREKHGTLVTTPAAAMLFFYLIGK